jgi:hypothetical protein
MPNKTSPTIPTAIAASVIAESVRNVLYGGSIQAMTSSAITETMTSAPQQIPHRSHDDDPFSRSPSVAFGKYQGGKVSFLTFLLALSRRFSAIGHLPQPHAGPLAILSDEDNASGLKG